LNLDGSGGTRGTIAVGQAKGPYIIRLVGPDNLWIARTLDIV
jgi:hypothetical protein